MGADSTAISGPLERDSEPHDLESIGANSGRDDIRLELRLLTCSNMVERHLRNGFRARFGHTLPRFDILAELDRAPPDGFTMGEVSNLLMVSNGNITGLVERMVQEGLIRRATSTSDRRSVRIRLTTAGKKLFDQMATEHAVWVEEMMRGIDRAEMQQLFALLGRLKSSLTAAKLPFDGETSDG